MIHGKALGQYKIVRNDYVFTIVNALGDLTCWSFDSQLQAVNHIIKVLLPMEKN